jgi:hypothetical protein
MSDDAGIEPRTVATSALAVRRLIIKGDFYFFSNIVNTASSPAPLDSTMSDDAGIEPRTVATSALAVRRLIMTL